MTVFLNEYRKLNREQRRAVDAIDGPLLVIAGPGTGKTQLLSARVAHILETTDSLPQNILCMTFTENGAENMRERLSRFIGQAAYEVQISTYHAFGGDLIRRFPQYFNETRLQSPIDELSKHQLLQSLVDKMSYDNPLKQTRHHVGDLIGTISEIKRALLTSDDLRKIAAENNLFISEASKIIEHHFKGFVKMPTILKALPLFEASFESLKTLVPPSSANTRFGSLAQIAAQELKTALETAHATNKTTTLTKWKNDWLAKNASNEFIFDGELENRRIESLARVLEQYQAALEEQGLYDFDDMILRAITALEQHDDFKYTLQEQYLYILLDEFQDTNAAQLKLVELLSDNPVHEGRPNIMAVGDDDQAIYAFQGAQYSNMVDFYRMYRDVQVVNLTDNYRSHADILEAAFNIAEQIDNRLGSHFPGMSKVLQAVGNGTPTAQVTRTEFLSDVAQYDWIATQIGGLIESGTDPRQIAVLAPKHKQLEPLVPHLNQQGVAVKYEKRENILETPVVKQLITMSKLLMALHRDETAAANALWPEVLSFDFWEIPTSLIWQIAWQVNDARDDSPNWSKYLLEDTTCRPIALFFLALAQRVSLETSESMLDYLTGSEPVITHEPDCPIVSSKLRSYYMSPERQQTQSEQFYETLSHLTVLRAKLRAHQQTRQESLSLTDLLDFISMYEKADERMMNTSPYSQGAQAVQLMTVFKSKGLEFEHVFLVCCQDDVWGGSSRGNSNKLTLPPNLEPIRHAGATDDERLRILFVAMTRAKRGLHLTSFLQTYSGKSTKRLKYFNEQPTDSGSYHCMILPQAVQAIINNDHTAPDLKVLQLDWQQRHIEGVSEILMKDLLEERLKSYQLSPTHLNNFTDMVYGGPEKFFMGTLLRFPQAPSVNSQYGSAIHDTLEWIQHQLDETGELPKNVPNYFEKVLRLKNLTTEQLQLETDRGTKALSAYLSSRKSMFKQGNHAEFNFRNEGVMLGDARMGGKIDLLEIDKENKTITVVDYKTGSSYTKWQSDIKLHKYKQQLYCYKLLIENSKTFRGYEVTKGRLDFIEPDKYGNINSLDLTCKEDEVLRTRQLIEAMWRRVMALEFPDTSEYSKDLKGIQAFENDLLAS